VSLRTQLPSVVDDCQRTESVDRRETESRRIPSGQKWRGAPLQAFGSGQSGHVWKRNGTRPRQRETAAGTADWQLHALPIALLGLEGEQARTGKSLDDEIQPLIHHQLPTTISSVSKLGAILVSFLSHQHPSSAGQSKRGSRRPGPGLASRYRLTWRT